VLDIETDLSKVCLAVAPHPGQNKLLWRTVLIELEADKLVVLSMSQ
jgi:hypothetical protein